jgi:DNA-binding response OmpR family regulator
MKETLPAGTTVDIYEEDRATRELMQQWLNDAGYRVRDYAGTRAPANSPVDLVILATQLPTLQTLGLIGTMRAFFPKTAFIVLPRQDTAEPTCREAAARSSGAARVLSKPVTRQVLLEAVRTLTSRRSDRPRPSGFQLK